jgi:DNA-binding GntR family transcriptional regulator
MTPGRAEHQRARTRPPVRVGTTGIREFLNRFQSFGLIEKRPNTGWLFKGFTINFALELFEIREMFELRSAVAFASLRKNSPYWREIKELHEEHLKVLQDIDHLYHDFSDLDSRFHRLVNSAAPNRFVDGFYDLITLIFTTTTNGTNATSDNATRWQSARIWPTSTHCSVGMPPQLNELVRRI